LAFTFALGACKKKDEEETPPKSTTPTETKDTEKPVAKFTTPTANTEFVLGNSIAVTASFTDNKDLASFEIILKDPAGKELKKETGDISGTSAEKTVNFTVDTAKAAGSYSLTAMVKDNAENAGDEVKVTIKLNKPDPSASDTKNPVISSFNTRALTGWQSGVNNDFEYWFTVTDETALDSVKVWVEDAAGTVIKNGSYKVSDTNKLSFSKGSSSAPEKLVVNPPSTGAHKGVIKVIDRNGNSASQNVTINVL
jgi:hypothetical protein